MNTHKQRGLSLVELMVALAVSSFMILGITQVYINNKRNYVFQQNQAANLDSSRFAVLMLDELLSRAGYRRAPDQQPSMLAAFPVKTKLSVCEEFPEGAAITKVKNGTGFCIRFQPAVAGEDLCDGHSTVLSNDDALVAPKDDEVIYLAIQYTPHNEDQGGTISCISENGRSELLEGIADMQVEFASDKDGLRLLKQNAYKKAEDWTASDGIVRAVRYSVLTASRPNQRDGDSVTFEQWQTNTASATSKTRLASRDQRHLYQAAVGSQAARNMMP